MYYENRSAQIFKYFIIAALSFVLGWQAFSYGLLDSLDEKEEFNFGTQEEADLTLFWNVWNELETKYVDADKVSVEDRVDGAIKGLVNSYDDPYTVFMSKSESEEFTASLEGTLEGIGAEITIEDESLTIVSPLKESPAEKAGLLPGDIIYQVNGEDTSEMTIFEAVSKIKGEKGTSVILTIIREGETEAFDVSIIRDSIDIESVSMEKLDNGIVYLSVNQFNDKTNEEFSKAVTGMILNEPKGLIIDLRYNGGGYLDIAVELLSYLLPSDTHVVTIKQRLKDDEKMKTNGNAKITNIPLVVLTNKGSASASEIVAGAIQDLKRGVIMGTQTFGKGSVQEVEFYNNGSSIRMTIAKWFTPNDRTIDHVGLEPDIIVETLDEDLENDYDRQKEEAIKYLENLK